MKLYLVRHGEADPLAATDHERELTELGKERVSKAAQVLKRLQIEPKIIYSSPRIRAVQTAEIIGDTLGMDITITEEVNFGFDNTNIHTLIKDLRSREDVMFVGHNPDMSQIVHKMTGASLSMKKGGLARIDIINSKVHRGELVWLIAPKVFEVLYEQPATSDLQKWLNDSEPLRIEESIDDMAGDGDTDETTAE